MLPIFHQYPDLYKSDKKRYCYFGDDGTRYLLIAGENGVTEEWISWLRNEHRKELNDHLRSLRYRRIDGHRDYRVISLEEWFAAGIAAEDSEDDVEEAVIRKEERLEAQEKIRQLRALCTEAQWSLLIRVHVEHVSQKQVAEEEGVYPSTIYRRLKRIYKLLTEI